MNQPYNEQDALLSSIFSDGTEPFCNPSEPDPGDYVTVRLRVMKDMGVAVTLLKGFPGLPVHMSLCRVDDMFEWYEAKLYCRERPIYYSFLVGWRGKLIHFNRTGAHWVQDMPSPDPGVSFRVIPGFHVPQWARGAIQYQILPDRFLNGNPQTDVQDREYYYSHDFIRHAASWDQLPDQDSYRVFYGGDLVGVREKLNYLQSLGVEVIYFNPIFVSPSMHGYDTQDYDYIDPHLTVIPKDGGKVLEWDDHDNAHATKYKRRTADLENLKASNDWFAQFCQEVHARGMRIILDGVFNHCGSFHRWFNREHIYRGNKGAYGHPKSPYRGYFGFRDEHNYHCWWDIETLPKLYYEQSAALCEEILQVGEKWVSEPYCIDGWRLDVGADLGQSREFNHMFWKEFRSRVKAANPEALIIAEFYGNPAEWLEGDEWDTVMNYDAFMDPLSFFLTGMEKHSDYRRDDLYQNGMAFFDMMFHAMAHMPVQSVYCAMDELSNHDHSRFMTRTNGRIGRLHTVGSYAAGEGIRPEIFREAAVFQMTWPGAPTIYYGDEAGVVGWTDPDNRRTYPWGHEDQSLIEMYATLSKLRRERGVLRAGSVKALCAGYGYIAYGRFDEDDALAVVINNMPQEVLIDVPLRDIGIPDDAEIGLLYITTDPLAQYTLGTVTDGVLRYAAPGNSAAILVRE